MNSKTMQATKPAASAKTARPAKPESTRISAAQRNTFRMMLATGATVAALVGAQAMAILDRGSTTTVAPSSSVNASNTGISGTSASSASYVIPIPTATAVTTTSNVVRGAVSQPRPSTKSS